MTSHLGLLVLLMSSLNAVMPRETFPLCKPLLYLLYHALESLKSLVEALRGNSLGLSLLGLVSGNIVLGSLPLVEALSLNYLRFFVDKGPVVRLMVQISFIGKVLIGRLVRLRIPSIEVKSLRL